MIEKIIIRNFQKHRKLELELGRVTTLVGPTDCGKSAVLRAVRWACLNRPSGDAFVRHGAEVCTVRLGAGGKAVTRQKGRDTNEYRLGDQVYRSFGTGVPDDVAHALDVGDVNFQRQHDPPFWLSLTPGEVSRELNKIVNLDLIDRVLAEAAKEVRRVVAEEEITRARLREAKARRKELAWAKEAEVELGNLGKLHTTLEETSQKRSRIAELVEKGERYTRQAQASCTLSQTTSRALSYGLLVKQIGERVARLGGLVNECIHLKGRICDLRRKAETLEGELREALERGCPLCGARTS